MAVTKNATYKIDNGTDFDTIYFKTIAAQVLMERGGTLEELLAAFPEISTYSAGTDYFSIKFKNGIIVQGSRVESTLTGGTAWFPMTFPNNCFMVVPTVESKVGSTQYYATSVRVDTRGLDSFTWTSWQGGTAMALGKIMYIAVGN